MKELEQIIKCEGIVSKWWPLAEEYKAKKDLKNFKRIDNRLVKVTEYKWSLISQLRDLDGYLGRINRMIEIAGVYIDIARSNHNADRVQKIRDRVKKLRAAAKSVEKTLKITDPHFITEYGFRPRLEIRKRWSWK